MKIDGLAHSQTGDDGARKKQLDDQAEKPLDAYKAAKKSCQVSRIGINLAHRFVEAEIDDGEDGPEEQEVPRHGAQQRLVPDLAQPVLNFL